MNVRDPADEKDVHLDEATRNFLKLQRRLDKDFYQRLGERIHAHVATVDRKVLNQNFADSQVQLAMARDELAGRRALQAAMWNKERWDEIQTRQWYTIYSVFERAQKYQESSPQHYRELQARAGAKGAAVKWQALRRTRDYAMELWREGTWRSMADFARRVADKVVAYGHTQGFDMRRENAERNILDWLREERRK